MSRIYPDENGALTLIDDSYGQDGSGEWFARPPGQHMGSLADHVIEVEVDGSITVSPSIQGENWHGYLERGIFRELQR